MLDTISANNIPSVNNSKMTIYKLESLFLLATLAYFFLPLLP